MNFDQKFFLHQSVDHQQSVRWVSTILKKVWELAQAKFHEIRDVLAVHKIGCELHHIAPTGPLGSKRFFNIAEDLDALRVKITDANGVAILVR